MLAVCLSAMILSLFSLSLSLSYLSPVSLLSLSCLSPVSLSLSLALFQKDITGRCGKTLFLDAAAGGAAVGAAAGVAAAASVAAPDATTAEEEVKAE